MSSHHFIESEWIGQGKTYDTNLPSYVAEAKAQLLIIPDAVTAKIPHDSIPVWEFIHFALPMKSKTRLVIYLWKCYIHLHNLHE